MKILRCVGVVLSCIVLFLQLLVIMSSHWYYVTYTYGLNIGPWRICGMDINYPICFNSPVYHEIMDVIRAFLVVAIVFSCLAVFLGVSSFFCKKVSTALLSSAVCSFLSGVFAIIGMAVFTYHIPKLVNYMLLQTASPRGIPGSMVIPDFFLGREDTSFEKHSYSWAFYISWFTIPALCSAGMFQVIAYKSEKKQGLRHKLDDTFLEQTTSLP